MRASFKSLLGGIALVAAGFNTFGQSIAIPNGSFELQSGVGQPFGVNINIDSWQKLDRPEYFPESGYNGFFWVQTAGVFQDTNPYVNRDGAQAAYVASFPSAGIYQDLTSVFAVGSSYNFTLGLFGKGMGEGAFLQLSLYYRDGGNNIVTIGTPTSVFYSPATFSTTPPLNLQDYSVSIPSVQPGDAWAGKNIGVLITSVYGDGNGYWDMDNARLSAVPEPGSIALLSFGCGALALARLRKRK